MGNRFLQWGWFQLISSIIFSLCIWIGANNVSRLSIVVGKAFVGNSKYYLFLNFLGCIYFFWDIFLYTSDKTCCLWILLVKFQRTIVTVENPFWFGDLYFSYIPLSIKGFTYLYCCIPVHICLKEKYLFILGIPCNDLVGLTAFKRGY